MVFDRIKEIIADQFEVDPELVTYGTSLIGDLDATSLDFIDLAMAIEDEYDVEVTDEALVQFDTVEDIVNFVMERI